MHITFLRLPEGQAERALLGKSFFSLGPAKQAHSLPACNVNCGVLLSHVNSDMGVSEGKFLVHEMASSAE